MGNNSGSRNCELAYIDCFAGPGLYGMEGKTVEGSPIIATQTAKNLLRTGHVRSLLLHLIDDKPKQVESLRAHLKALQPYPPNLKLDIKCADSRVFVPDLLRKLNSQTPAFFLIDPYGHPLSLPVISTILRRQRTEVLINLMWFQINRDLNNPKVKSRLNELFGDEHWHSQPFMSLRGVEREKAFLEYFVARTGARYVLPFKSSIRQRGFGGVRKSTTGRRLNGRTYDELPERMVQPVSPADDCLRLALEIEAAYPRKQFIPVTCITTAVLAS